MKVLLVVIYSFIFIQLSSAQSVGINNTGNNPDPSAILDVESTSKGMLVPRMTSSQRGSISGAAEGLLVFDTTTGTFWFYGGGSWQNLVGSNALLDADSDTKIEVEKTIDEDTIRITSNGHEIALFDDKTFHLGAADGSVFIGKNAGQGDNGANNNIVAVGDSALVHNSIGAFKAYHSLDNTAIGDKTLKENDLGDRNTALGARSLMSNTTGQENIAIGVDALNMNVNGKENVAIGNESQSQNISGQRNISLGHSALLNNDGNNNIALGYSSLSLNSEGNSNIGIGTFSLRFNDIGDYNIGIGNSTLYKNETGENNISIGASALYNATSDNNIAIGRSAAHKNTTGGQNIALGTHALYNNTTVSGIVAIGDSALFNNGLGATGTDATYNTAVGDKALLKNEQGKHNTALGSQALANNDYANYNTAVGVAALLNNISGNTNTAVGASTLSNHTTGEGNIAIGYASLNDHMSGARNTAVGTYSLLNSTLGANNVSLGYYADGNNEQGANNTIIGYQAGKYNMPHSKSGNVFLGYQAGFNEIGDNKLYIENSNSGSPLLYGEFDNNYLQVNGELNINGTYNLPIIDGGSDQVLSTNGSGDVAWRDVDESKWVSGVGGKIQYSSGNVGINLADPLFPLDVLSFGNTAQIKSVGFASGNKIALQAQVYNLPTVTTMDSLISIKASTSGSKGINIGILTNTVAGTGENIGLIAEASNVDHIAAKFDGQVILGNSLETSNQVMIAPNNNSGSSGDASLFLSEDRFGDFGMYWEYNGGTNKIDLFGYQNGVIHGSHIAVGRDNGIIEFGGDAFIFNPDVAGDSRFTTDEIEIRGGSDLAENFDITDVDIMPTPGMVVSIDPYEIGKLMITKEAKDKKVAGIISGANGIETGMYMGQKGSIADGEYPIALTGRVYVFANKEGGIIKPGDFLTSSNQIGYACKVDKQNQAEGAIIGKAMSGIDENGYVLVLVNLQ